MNQDEVRLFNEINLLDFALTEITLFLDTHPDNQEAMRFFNYYNRLKQDKMKEFAASYGPLTRNQATDQHGDFLWTVQPWPWEGEME